MARIPIDSDIRVYHSRFLATAQGPALGRALMIVPDRSDWNDFSANFHAKLHVLGVEDPGEPISMRLMFAGAARTYIRADELRGDLPNQPIDTVSEPFVSILADEQSYRRLVELLGFEDSVAALRQMHDAVVTRLEGEDDETLALVNTIRFHQSALRENHTWVAYRQADRYLSPNRPPDVADAAHSFTAHVHLPGMRGDHHLEADFGDAFPLARRSLVLVGQNGTGKTRLLRAIIEGLRMNPPWADEAPDGPAADFAPAPQFSRLAVFSSVSSDPYPQHIAPWEGIDYRYCRMIGGRAAHGDELTLALIDCIRADHDVQGFGSRGALELLSEILEPLEIRDNLHVELRQGDGQDALPNPIEIEGRLYFPLFRNMNEQRNLQLFGRILTEMPPRVLTGRSRTRDLSSGELALLRFAAQAIAALRPGTLFLFDEPETHLHPKYISQFMAMLDRLLELSGSIALIATHSAYVVREVPARRVRIIARDAEEQIEIDPPGMQTFGASIDTISQFVFGDSTPQHRYQEVLERWIDDQPEASVQQVRERFGADLNAEMMSYVAELIATRDQA